MPINHKFLNREHGFFPDQNFYTENVILKNRTFKPEVMIIGTFNPDTPNANFADFYYGRNYFWTGFKRLLNPQYRFIHERRMPQNGQYNHLVDPTLEEVLNLCSNFKLTFSDLISGVFPNINPEEYEILPNDNVFFNGQEFNLIQDNAGNGVLGLANLDEIGLISWNTMNIVEYLLINPQVKSIYLTRQQNGIWGNQWALIANHPELQDREFLSIVTPSGQGLPNLPAPYNSRFKTILHYWVWNGMNHQVPANNLAYGHFDHDWLTRCGVDIHQF